MRRKDSGFENYCGVIAPYKLIWYNNTRSLSLEEDYKNGQVVFYMKKVRINNSITNVLKSTIIILLITCIALLLLCIFFMYIFITYGTSFDDGSKMYLTLILASLIITLILFIVITVQTIIKRNNELKYNYKAKNIKYLEFSNKGITICDNDNVMFKVVYEDIDEMKLMLRTKNAYSYMNTMLLRYRYVGITGMNLQLKYNDNKVHKVVTINTSSGFTLLDKIFEIVYFSQYISEFSYKFSKQHEEELQKTFGKAIESYKANNYKHTFRSFGYTMWAIPTLIFTIILSFFILFFVGYLILAGTV